MMGKTGMQHASMHQEQFHSASYDMMGKSGMQHGSLRQEPWMTGILQKRLLCFLIPILSRYIVVSCIFTSVFGEAGCSNQEKQSLLAFKRGLHDPVGCLVSWNVSVSCCDWKGIYCYRQTGSVVAVDLHSCNLSGDFRPEILIELMALEYLDVSFNKFTGLSIPTELGFLKNLRYLNLSTVGFAGTIPWQLGNLSSLIGFDLSSSASMLTSHDLSWLANLTALKYLSLDGVDLSATSSSWGKSVSHLSQLINLTMSNCGLTGSIPPSLQNLRYLETLYLDGNFFHSEFPHWIVNMTSLVALQMNSSYLNGSLPYNLSQMPRIERIALGNNKLYANFSQIFHGPWKRLTFFQMRKSNLEGSIPSSIGNLSSLAVLDIKHNKLKGTIPESLGLLRSLTVLDLGHNQLRGAIPFSIGSLSKLTNISLAYNNLTGAISESHFLSLYNLKYLDLSSNKLTFNITNNWKPPFLLYVLKLSHCHIAGSFPPFLKTQRSLMALELTNNSLTGKIPSWLWSLPKLEKLFLSHNQLEGPIPSQLYTSTSLKQVELRDNNLHGNVLIPVGSSVAGFPWELDLSINKITGPVPQEICRMLRTSNFLSLASNKLQGQIPACICDQTEYLEALDLSGNKLNGQFPSSFGNCSSLKVLNVANNQFEGQIPAELGKLKKLQVLHINDNRISGQIPSSLRNCKMLEILDLSGNSLSGNLPEWIADLWTLRILVLRSNHLQGEIPTKIRYLERLQFLDLAMNKLSGSIPLYLSSLTTLRNETFTSSGSTELRYGDYYKEEIYLVVKGHEWAYKYILSSVTSLDFSANNLSGHIPVDMGYLKGLHSLNLSHNQLTGYIPHELGEMENLEALDISCNQLSGKIPETFADLDFLGYLNLSNNILSGRIPDLPHLLTFEASSFLGNSELCGPQVFKQCRYDSSYSGEVEESVEGEHWWESWKAAMGMGWAIGLGSVIGMLALSRRLSTRYYKFVDNIVNGNSICTWHISQQSGKLTCKK